MVTGGSFFSRGSKVRYSGRVERELADDYGLDSLRSSRDQDTQSPENQSRRSRSQAYTSRRSTSEPLRADYDEGEEEDEEDLGDDLSLDQPSRRHPRSQSHSVDRMGRRDIRLSRLHEDGSSWKPLRKRDSALKSLVFRFIFVSFCLVLLFESFRFAW